MEVIRTEKLVKTFIDGTQEIRVLRGIDLTIEAGQFLSITGSSGTGKSTLVYQLGLLDYPTSGEVFLHNKPANKMSVVEKTQYRLKEFGFVFQDYALIPEMKAWENVALSILMRGSSIEVAKQKAVDALNKLGIGNRTEHFPGQLSGGESQRVSVARAIVHGPKILFADEPTANLDSDRSRQIIDIFHNLHKEGQTIVMVTHEIEYAKEAERLIVMKDGEIFTDEKLK